MKYLLLLLSIFIISCSSSDESIEHIIEYGNFGSLCGIKESITIVDNDVSYLLSSIVCEIASVEDSRSLSSQEKEDLQNIFDDSIIVAKKDDSCNRCFDGIDFFIRIEKDDIESQTTFSIPGEERNELRSTVNILDQIFESFR